MRKSSTVHKGCLRRILMLFALCLIMGNRSYAEMKEDEMTEQTYRLALNQYLKSELDLEEYDKQLAESEEHFIPNDEESMPSAQKEGDMGLSYIYLRNPLHMERLTDEQKDILMREADTAGTGEGPSEELLQLVRRTFPSVISEKEIKTEQDRQVKTYYDSALQQNFVTVDTLVLKIGTMPEYDEEGNYVNHEHEFEKEDFLTAFAEQMEEDLKGRLGETPIRVLLH